MNDSNTEGLARERPYENFGCRHGSDPDACCLQRQGGRDKRAVDRQVLAIEHAGAASLVHSRQTGVWLTKSGLALIVIFVVGALVPCA